jgi:hypothetical protein
MEYRFGVAGLCKGGGFSVCAFGYLFTAFRQFEGELKMDRVSSSNQNFWR